MDKSNNGESLTTVKPYYCENEKDRDAILAIHRGVDRNKELFVINEDIDKLKKLFFDDHKKIAAAGGIVLNSKGEILFIKRLGFWDLPKGKIEKNEKKKPAAIREIEEECGISNPKIEKKLLKTFHTYTANGKNYLKTTHWYLMHYSGSEKLTPQEEEGITEVLWVDPKKMELQVYNTYNSILDVLNSYIK